MKDIYSMIDDLRAKSKDKASLAKKIGISLCTLDDLLSGRNRKPHIKTVTKIREYYEYVSSKQNKAIENLEIGRSYKIRYDGGLICGKVIGDYPRFYLIQCGSHKECFNKSDLSIMSTRIVKTK